MNRAPPQLSVSPGMVLQSFSKAEALQWRERWSAVYVGHHRSPGLSRYLWHQFSWEGYPAISGEEAEQCYARQVHCEVVVLRSDRVAAAWRVSAPPTQCDLSDYHVFPANLAWTMAFTHEDGLLGPYFAQHPNYEALNRQMAREHAAATQKAQQLAHARKMGYL